jgi:hypothetical protein
MKLRHRAVPGHPRDNASSVPLDGRLYLNVTVAGNADETEKPFWFRKVCINHPFLTEQSPTCIKSIITGKALDLLADHYKISISDTSVRLCICISRPFTFHFVSLSVCSKYQTPTRTIDQNCVMINLWLLKLMKVPF